MTFWFLSRLKKSRSNIEGLSIPHENILKKKQPQCSRSLMFFKIGVLKNIAVFRPAASLKRDSNTDVFQ